MLKGFRAAIARDPVLVVPTADDTERFERELVSDGRVVLGATVCTFDRLFALVARATEVSARPPLSPVQRKRVAREAIERSSLRRLKVSARRPGFAAALDGLISELQAAAIDPASFRQRAAEAGDYELELAGLYEVFCTIRDQLGRDDSHTVAAAATAALRARPDSWGARPVFLYGFDDLTIEQLELLRELWRTCDLTIALPYEDREALAARAGLFAELRDVEGVTLERLSADPANTASRTLFELERRFGEPLADPIANDGGLELLASAGELAEVEAIGAEVARLLHGGVEAGQIAIVLRDPASGGPLFRRVLARFDIPLAVQADVTLPQTVTGTGLLALLSAAVGRRRATDLLAYLRTPGIASPARVDWFERSLRRGRMRTADEALAAWRNGERRELDEIDRLRDAGSGAKLLLEAGRQARWIAESPLYRGAEVAGVDRALELRAGAEVERALTELLELGLSASPAELVEAVTGLRVPLWRGPTEGRVRVISPYRARARRVQHLLVASLQDGDFPRRDSGGPLLSDDSRSALALPPRTRAELEDRYLFSVCLSRPSERLVLSWRSADDEGGATARSPFVDQVRELIAPALPADLDRRDEVIASEAGGRGLARSVFEPGSAPSEDELARALAALSAGGAATGWMNDDGTLAGPGLDSTVWGRIGARLAEARASTEEQRLRPGPLTHAPVIEEMRAKKLFGPSTLEEYALCPYRWFVSHELEPQRIEPEQTAPTAGQIAHEVLERLYAEGPGGERRPTSATLGRWRQRAAELVGALGAESLPPERPDTGAALRRIEGLVLAFIADEARGETPFLPDPALAEASFGFEDSSKPALQLGDGGVHGRIDRIDIGPGGEALVQDYKSSSKVDGGPGMLGRGKLQLQLYMLAARELWEVELAGGLYRPLGGSSDRRPKGLLRKAVREELAGLDPRPGDHLDDAAFEDALEAARVRTEEIIAGIQAGDIGRRPLGGRCPDWCRLQPICRRERGLPDEERSAEEDEADE